MLCKCFISKSSIFSISLLILAKLIKLYVYKVPGKQAKIIEFISIIIAFKVKKIAFLLKIIEFIKACINASSKKTLLINFISLCSYKI